MLLERGYSLWVQPHQGDQDHQGNQQDPEVRDKNKMSSEFMMIKLAEKIV